MLFGRKKQRALEKQLNQLPAGRSYWSIVRREFRKNKLAMWALYGLLVLLIVALLADFIANEKPIYCKIEGETYWPIFHQYGVDMGLAKWDVRFIQTSWRDQPYESVLMPLIPYSATTLDMHNANFKGPFDEQQVASLYYRHWLGTDMLGRDVAAGMIRGTRIAMMVGVIAMSVAALIGILLGVLAGYFGDDRCQISRGRLLWNSIGLIGAIFFGFMARSYELTNGADFWWQLLLSCLIALMIISLANWLGGRMDQVHFLSKKVTVPVDIIVMRLVEIMNSIPTLLLLLALLAVISQASIYTIMLIIGLVSWTSITRFVRAEMLRIRSLDYIQASQAMGFGEWRIIRKHAFPNGLTPVLITIAFGIAAAILVEAFLSFLGLGIALEEVSWGKMLSMARSHFSAWWLAIFPGLAIFITVTIFNLIGDGLTEALDPKLKQFG